MSGNERLLSKLQAQTSAAAALIDVEWPTLWDDVSELYPRVASLCEGADINRQDFIRWLFRENSRLDKSPAQALVDGDENKVVALILQSQAGAYG